MAPVHPPTNAPAFTEAPAPAAAVADASGLDAPFAAGDPASVPEATAATAETGDQLPVEAVHSEDLAFAAHDGFPHAEADGTLDAAADEQIKVIGSLRIGIPLYNVYLNEADEWSRRLVTELSEWSLEPDHAVADSTVALAHSLAGSSATVGFDALSDMARALEHALQQSQAHYQGGVAAEYAGLFVDAAEDIRRLLHQFAAGFLKESQPGLLTRLREIEFPEQVSVFPPELDDADFAAVDEAPDSLAFAADAAALEAFLSAEEARFIAAASLPQR
ncbi:MAG: hypothetical protein EOO54_18985 [Haliea sp.]|nr:MAG: hypothetical protein EOO54_18985 [Haliea sp.]